MPLKDKAEQRKCIETVWGKLISEKDAYRYATREIAAFCANLFQVMRILEPDFNKRTEAICEVAYSGSTFSGISICWRTHCIRWTIAAA